MANKDIFQDEEGRSRQLADKAMDRIRFSQTDKPVPVLRLEVEFESPDYLRELANRARKNKLISGFTIDPRETTYEWEGKPRTDTIFVLRTTIPRGGYSTAKLAYRHFYDGIRERWDVPLIYINDQWQVNPDFEAWLKSVHNRLESRVVVERRSASIGKWTYAPNSPYIHLWSSEINDDTHEEISRIWENKYASNYRGGSDLDNPHLAAMATHRNAQGLIVAERTTVYIFGDIRQDDVYESISKGRGLRAWDRECLEIGKYGLTFEFPYRDLL